MPKGHCPLFLLKTTSSSDMLGLLGIHQVFGGLDEISETGEGILLKRSTGTREGYEFTLMC